MAMVVGPERAVVTRGRVHGDAVAVNGAALGTASPRTASSRTMVKRTAPLSEADQQRVLSLVPRHRRNARLIGLACALLFAMMLGAAAFQTQLARRQLTLDTIDRQIRTNREQYEVLRRERAELRSPGRLAEAATAIGMAPATQTDFVSIDPTVVATVQRSGAVGLAGDSASHDEIVSTFSEYAGVKNQTEANP